MRSNKLIIKYKEPPKLSINNKTLSIGVSVSNHLKQAEFLNINLLYIDSEIFNKISTFEPISYINSYQHISDFYNKEMHNLTSVQQDAFRIVEVEYDNVNEAEEAYNNLQRDENVEYVQFDYIYEYPSYEFEQLPDDSNKQWNFGFINANNYWDISEGDDIIVAVIDSGLNCAHYDIKDNVYKKDGKIVGTNYSEGGQPDEFQDDDGHGTHVSGIIGALNNNSGILGLAAKCKIMPVKIFNNNFSRSSACAKGIEWAVNNGAKIINISWGGYLCTTEDYLIRDKINYAYEKGVIVVCAAGNEKKDVLNFFPANLKNVITVGGVNNDNSLYGSFGDKITVYAPNNLIYSLSNNSNTEICPNSGTSFATPHVTALIALMLKMNPELSFEEIKYIIEEKAESFTIKGESLTKKKININHTLECLKSKTNKKMETTKNQTSNTSLTDEFGTISEYTCDSPQVTQSGNKISFELKTQVQDQNYKTVAGSPYLFSINGKNGFIHHFTNGKKTPMTTFNHDLITKFQDIDVSGWDFIKGKAAQIYYYNEADEIKVEIIEKFKKILASQSEYKCFRYEILHKLLNLSDEILDALDVAKFIDNCNKKYDESKEPHDPKQAGGVVLMF